MPRNNDYKTIQVPIQIQEQISEYCDLHGLKIGRFIGFLFLNFVSGSLVVTGSYGRN